MSTRFYVNLPLAPGPFTLDGPEAHHLATVCRLRPGAEICLFNGAGREYPARITQVARRAVQLEILRMDAPERELPFHLEVAAPVPKGDRGQFLIEKLTELGVTQFVPLQCRFSNLHPRDCKVEKLERHVIEASKQCGRNVLMRMDDLTTWETYIKRGNVDEVRILAHLQPSEPRASATALQSNEPRASATGLCSDLTRTEIIRLAVGPEGGFTDDEVMLAFQHGWQAISLGPRILRVETAAIVLAALVIGNERECSVTAKMTGS